MARQKITDQATTDSVDWSFYEDDEIVSHIESAVWMAYRGYEEVGVDVDDLRQDAFLYVACRPEMVERYREDLPFLSKTVWDYLNDRCERYANAALALRPYDDGSYGYEKHDPEKSRLARYLEMGDDADYEAVNLA